MAILQQSGWGTYKFSPLVSPACDEVWVVKEWLWPNVAFLPAENSARVLCPEQALAAYIDGKYIIRQTDQLFVCCQNKDNALSRQHLSHWIVGTISLFCLFTITVPCPQPSHATLSCFSLSVNTFLFSQVGLHICQSISFTKPVFQSWSHSFLEHLELFPLSYSPENFWVLDQDF